MTAEYVNGHRVVDSTPLKSPLKKKDGTHIEFAAQLELLLENGDIVYGCRYCDWTTTDKWQVRVHLNLDCTKKPYKTPGEMKKPEIKAKPKAAPKPKVEPKPEEKNPLESLILQLLSPQEDEAEKIQIGDPVMEAIEKRLDALEGQMKIIRSGLRRIVRELEK